MGPKTFRTSEFGPVQTFSFEKCILVLRDHIVSAEKFRKDLFNYLLWYIEACDLADYQGPSSVANDTNPKKSASRQPNPRFSTKTSDH